VVPAPVVFFVVAHQALIASTALLSGEVGVEATESVTLLRPGGSAGPEIRHLPTLWRPCLPRL
jgi:hypothetical protein